jgi:hypothetical protein
VDFDYSKITCSKEIGGGTGFKEFCQGKEVEKILELAFDSLVQSLNLKESEDQFFLYLEWSSLRAGIIQYLGKEQDFEPDRYQIASIDYGEDGVKIRQVIKPPNEMPKISSCLSGSN